MKWKGVERRIDVVFKVLYQNLLGGTEENYEKP
jgi:hypothetical protein